MKRSVILILILIGAVAIGVTYAPRHFGFPGKQPLFATQNGAIDGFDPVSYFAEGEAARGSEAHTMEWRGETWRFVSDDHLRLFEANPEKYAPQYGGYCAYGLSEGYLADVDPGAWTIVEGRLFLNFDRSVMEDWRRTRERRIPQADQHWSKL